MRMSDEDIIGAFIQCPNCGNNRMLVTDAEHMIEGSKSTDDWIEKVNDGW
jgi:hypothetical protein